MEHAAISIDLAMVAVTLAGILFISFMKGAFGGGFAIIGIPFLSLVMDTLSAGALLAPLFIPMDIAALRYWPPPRPGPGPMPPCLCRL